MFGFGYLAFGFGLLRVEFGEFALVFRFGNASGQVIAAISISGPTGRMGAAPGRRYAPLDRKSTRLNSSHT